MAKHSLDFWLTSEDLPDPDNRVSLDRDGNIVLSYTPNNDEGHKRLIAAEAVRADLLQHPRTRMPHFSPRNLFVGQRIPLAGVAHQNGTVRFGNDPQSSALDAELQGPRGRQPLRRGRQLLPVERRGEPGADGHGQCAPGRRSPSRAARRAAADAVRSWRDDPTRSVRPSPLAAPQRSWRPPAATRRRGAQSAPLPVSASTPSA